MFEFENYLCIILATGALVHCKCAGYRPDMEEVFRLSITSDFTKEFEDSDVDAEAEIILWKGGKYANYHEWVRPDGPFDYDCCPENTVPIKNVDEVVDFIKDAIMDIDPDDLEEFEQFLKG